MLKFVLVCVLSSSVLFRFLLLLLFVVEMLVLVGAVWARCRIASSARRGAMFSLAATSLASVVSVVGAVVCCVVWCCPPHVR